MILSGRVERLIRRMNTKNGNPVWSIEIAPHRPFRTKPDAMFAHSIGYWMEGKHLTVEMLRGEAISYIVHCDDCRSPVSTDRMPYPDEHDCEG